MFKHIEIKMRTPICDCFYEPHEYESGHPYCWLVMVDPKGGPGLGIQCQECGTSLAVPSSQFLGIFSFDEVDESLYHYNRAVSEQDQEGKGPLLKVLEFPSEQPEEENNEE